MKSLSETQALRVCLCVAIMSWYCRTGFYASDIVAALDVPDDVQ